MIRHISTASGCWDQSEAALRELRGSCRCGVLPAEVGRVGAAL